MLCCNQPDCSLFLQILLVSLVLQQQRAKRDPEHAYLHHRGWLYFLVECLQPRRGKDDADCSYCSHFVFSHIRQTFNDTALQQYCCGPQGDCPRNTHQKASREGPGRLCYNLKKRGKPAESSHQLPGNTCLKVLLAVSQSVIALLSAGTRDKKGRDSATRAGVVRLASAARARTAVL